MNDIAETVRQFIVSNYLPGESPANLHNDTPLVSSGILDSLAVMTVITFVETQFQVKLDVYDTSVENFDNIQHIAAAISRKQSGGAAR